MVGGRTFTGAADAVIANGFFVGVASEEVVTANSPAGTVVAGVGGPGGGARPGGAGPPPPPPGGRGGRCPAGCRGPRPPVRSAAAPARRSRRDLRGQLRPSSCPIPSRR